MRRSLSPTLPCQASHHSTPLLQPGVTPLAPGTPPPAPRTIPIELSHNTEGIIQVLTDDTGVAVGKRFWAPGTKQVVVRNQEGPVLGLIGKNVLEQLARFENGPDADRVKQHLLRTAPVERYDFAAEDRRIAKAKLDGLLLQPTKKGLVEQYARSEAMRREHEANVAFVDASLMEMAGEEADEVGEEEYFVRVERAKVAKAKARKAKLAKGPTKARA